MKTLPNAGDTAYGNNKSIKILIMKKDNKTMKHAYVKITDDKMAEMEDVLRKMGNLDEIDPKVIVHELIRKVFGVAVPERSGHEIFKERFDIISHCIHLYIANRISSGGSVLKGYYVTYASSDNGFYEDCVVREEVNDGVLQFWFAPEYVSTYDFEKDEEGAVSGPYSLDCLDLSEVSNIIASNDKDMEKNRDDLDKLIKDAFQILDSMEDFEFLKKPLMVSIDYDGKWYNEIIYRVYRRMIYGAKSSAHFHCSCIGYADLMSIVDAVLEHEDK